MVKKNGCGILALSVIFTMIAISCDNGNGLSDNLPKILVITDVPENIYSNITSGGSSGGMLGIYKSGSTEGLASAYLSNSDIIITGPVSGLYSISIPLYNPGTKIRWTGDGVCDILIILYNASGLYRAYNVDFSSESTSISFNSFT